MRKNLSILIISLIFVIFQESFMLEFFGSALNPNLIICLCFGFMLIDDYEDALFTAFIGGLFYDFLGVGIVGLTSFILILFLAASQWVKKTIFRGAWVQILFIIITTLFFKVAMTYPDFVYSSRVLMSGVFNVAVALVFYALLEKARKRFLSAEYRIKA